MDLLSWHRSSSSSDDDATEEEDHSDRITKRTAVVSIAGAPRRRRRGNIALVTEAASPAVTAGRWATHCSLPIQWSRSEHRRAWAAIRATCDWIAQSHPTWRGRCVPLLPWPRRNHADAASSTNASSSLSAAATTDANVNATVSGHVSLTRPDISLHTNQVDSFVKLLTREMQTVAQVAPFSIQFQYTNILELFHNESRTKSYGIWRCFDAMSGASLEQLTQCCDTILEPYQQAPYRYSNSGAEEAATTTVPPVFHVSLVRFEPAVLLLPSDSTATAWENSQWSPPGECNVSSSSCREESEEDEDAVSVDSSSSEGSADSRHQITQVICQFGGAAKMHCISLRNT
jgi:Uncharacterised conserved protein